MLASAKANVRQQPRKSLLSGAPAVVETIDKRNRVTIKVRSGDTLIGMLGRINISSTERTYWARSVMRDMGGHILRPGQEIHFFLASPGIIRGRSKNSPAQLKAIEIEHPGANLIWERGIHGILFQNGENPFDVELRTAGAVVENSFVDDARKAGISPALLTQLANIFHTEIDFDRDLQKGDSFKVPCLV